MIKRIKHSVAWRLKKYQVILESYRQRKVSHELIILDDLFPYELSSWRFAEYNGYLRHYPTAVAYSTGDTMGYFVKETRSFLSILVEYADQHPEMRGRVQLFHPSRWLRGKLGYVMFLRNADRFLDVLEANKLPFVMQLFPGGGFELNQPESDRQLARVCNSPYLQHIIATQSVTRDYLIAKGFCPPEKITYIYAAVLPMAQYLNSALARPAYPVGKPTLDLCFVASKYMPEGRDKGYDLFIAAAHLLAPQFPALRFHVVGSFGEADIPLGGLAGKIQFYGNRPTAWFVDFYVRMDAIVSPNRPFVLAPGAFDGFPTGCCLEAGAAGVAIFCTDALGQNASFIDGEDIVLLDADAEDVARKLGAYLADPDRLQALGQATRRSIAHFYDEQARLQDRLDVLNAQLNALNPA